MGDTGLRIGRYEVRERLGAGAMGVVYRARDPKLGRDVAVKMLHPDALGPRAVAQLRAEAQALGKLSHPNVVSVLDVGEARGRMFVAMELVQGATLREWIERARPDARTILAKFRAVGRGLAAVHAAGLIHRDVKPDNVLIDALGRPRMVDFGLARCAAPSTDNSSDPDALSTIRHKPTIAGTPAYVSPEQRFGCTIDARADQFSFCVSIVEALTGHRPRVDPCAERPPKIRIPGIPHSVRKAIRRGLSPRPADRYVDIDELLAALDPNSGRRKALASLAVAIVTVILAPDAGSRAADAGPHLEPTPAVASDPHPRSVDSELSQGTATERSIEVRFNNAMARREFDRAVEMASVVVFASRFHEERVRWLRFAEAAFARIEQPTSAPLYQIEIARSRVAEPLEALAHLDAALLVLSKPGQDDFFRVMVFNQKGTRFKELGRRDSARWAFSEAARVLIETRGEESVFLASPYANLGALAVEVGDDDEARRLLHAAWDIRRRANGSESPRTLDSAVRFLQWSVENDSLDDAVLVLSKTDIDASMEHHQLRLLCGEGELLRQQGHVSGARERFERAFASGELLPACALGLAELYRADGDPTRAAELMREVRAEFLEDDDAQAEVGRDTHLSLTVCRARALLDEGRASEASAELREALEATGTLGPKNRWVREANALLNR